MPIPETTSVEAIERYIGGKCLYASKGKAWKNVKAWIVALENRVDGLSVPSVSEPFLLWIMSGEVETREREAGQPWSLNWIKKGTFYLMSAGAPYECSWKSLNGEPFEVMYVFLELPLLKQALDEFFGTDAAQARLRDISAFTDDVLHSLAERLRDELIRRKASPLFVQSIAGAMAVHLVRNYSELQTGPHSISPALPGYKIRQITDWMAKHLAEAFDLERLATQAGLSKFHFNRLFKSATGISPSQYQIDLRIDRARQLLRETRKTATEIALEIGYATPSHFAQVFRKETGLSPSEYRRKR